MKHIATMALLLVCEVAAASGHQRPVRLTFSGNGGASAANLQQPNTNNAEENVVGKGSLGSFTFRNITAIATSPAPSSTCAGPNQAYFPRVAGGGLFRFADGSLLKVKLVEGGDCIDFAAFEGRCTLTLQITGGTGRFKDASGKLTYTETAVPVVLDATNNPVLTTEVGEVTGSIYGAARDEERPDDQQ